MNRSIANADLKTFQAIKAEAGLKAPRDSVELFEKYAEAIMAISRSLREADIEINAFSHEIRYSPFLRLPVERQESLLVEVESYRRLCASAIDHGIHRERNPQTLAWWIVRDLKLRPLSDVFSHIQQNDVIEIYTRGNIQIFRSFNFFKFLSYSLDQLYSHEWWDLYERDQAVTEQMLKALDQVYSDPVPRTYLQPFPRHMVREKFSKLRKSEEIESRLLSPLFDAGGDIVAYLNVFRIVSPETGVARA